MRRRDHLARLVGLACERHGRLNVLVSNTSIGPVSPLDDLRVKEREEMVDVDVGEIVVHPTAQA